MADDEPLRLMYTSGTESGPRACLLSSRSLISQYVSCIIDGGMSSDDVEVHSLPMYHCAQLDCFFTPDVYLGATGRSSCPAPIRPRCCATIERSEWTKLFCPPTVWISLLRHPDFDADGTCRSLRKGYYGASPMPVEVLREIQPPALDRGGDRGRRAQAGRGTLSVEEVQAHSRTLLAPYKRPKYVVVTDALPKNPSGKVLKRDLRERYAGLGHGVPAAMSRGDAPRPRSCPKTR